MASRAAYRPLPSTPPGHSPHGSIASSRSRTPGQLSLHDYRKRQASPAPGPAVARGGQRTVKRKGGLPSFHGPAGDVPNAPPTPPHLEDDSHYSQDATEDGEDEYGDENEAISRFLGDERVRRAAQRWASRERMDGAAAAGRAGLLGSHGSKGDRAAWGSISSAPAAINRHLGIPKAEILPVRPHGQLSPPPSPATPLLDHHHSLSSPSVNFPPISHQLPLLQPSGRISRIDQRQVLSIQPCTGPFPVREPEFNPIKRLPRPSLRYSPLISSPLSSNPPSLTHTPSPFSPFSLSQVDSFNSPSEPVQTQGWPLPDRPLSLKTTQGEQESVSLSGLLHLYGSSFELLNRHDSLAAAHISASSSGESSPSGPLLPSLLPPTTKPIKMANPFAHPDDALREDVRESMYNDDFDSRSIAAQSPDPPGMRRGVRDYSDLVRIDQHSEANASISQRSVGPPPSGPLPALPEGAEPKTRVRRDPPGFLDHADGYENPLVLLGPPSGDDFERTAPAPLFSSSPPGRRTTASGLNLPQFSDEHLETESIVRTNSTGDSDGWETTVAASAADLNKHPDSMGEAFPFPSHKTTSPPWQYNSSRQGVKYSKMPSNVSSPQSTVAESVGPSPRRHKRAEGMADIYEPVASPSHAQDTFHEIPLDVPTRVWGQRAMTRTRSGAYFGPGAIDPAQLSLEPPEDGLLTTRLSGNLFVPLQDMSHHSASSSATQLCGDDANKLFQSIRDNPGASSGVGQTHELPVKGWSYVDDPRPPVIDESTPYPSPAAPTGEQPSLLKELFRPGFENLMRSYRSENSGNSWRNGKGKAKARDSLEFSGMELPGWESQNHQVSRQQGRSIEGDFSATPTYPTHRLRDRSQGSFGHYQHEVLTRFSGHNSPNRPIQRPAAIHPRVPSNSSSTAPLIKRDGHKAQFMGQNKTMDARLRRERERTRHHPAAPMPAYLAPRPMTADAHTSTYFTTPAYSGGTSLLPLYQEREVRRRRAVAATTTSAEAQDVRRVALLCLAACAVAPPMLLLYGAGALDGVPAWVVDRRRGGGGGVGRGARPRMPARYRLAALLLFLGELILVLVVLVAWGLTRGGR